ncbi:MAG TPA: hypothetical protein VLS89_04730, partial [Candidatus Nanopelagicales bacterium]|nr:hypothetical protein [Candidatus Nanopelagicales bacterium]
MPKPKKDPTPAAGSDASADAEALDPKAAEKALTELTPRLLALSADSLATASTGVQRAAVTAAAVGRFVKSPDVVVRFERLPDEEFQIAAVHDLEKVALAAWYTTIKLQSASANRSEAKLPVSLVLGATEVKQRMLKVSEYHLG